MLNAYGCMARAHVKQNAFSPYHITGRCPNRERFRPDMDEVWNLLCDYLYLANKKYGLLIHSFVLMSNHFHLIASLQNVNIGIIMREFMSETSREMNRLTGRVNQNWGGRYYKCVLENYFHQINTYKYVYQNPVRAKLCERVEDWKYSTLNGLLGRSVLPIPLAEDMILFNPHFLESELDWLNRPIESRHCDAIRAALIRRTFKVPRRFQRKNFLEENKV